MAYSTEAQILAEFAGIEAGSGKKLTSDNITQWIAEADARIDAMLCQKYVVPITGTTALLLIRRLSIDLVADIVREKMKVKTGDEKTAQGSVKTATDRAIETLSKIAKGEIILPGATLISSTAGIQSYVTDESYCPTFQRDVDQW